MEVAYLSLEFGNFRDSPVTAGVRKSKKAILFI